MSADPGAPASARGEMASRVAAHDWSRTPLGPTDRWPQSLRVAVGICLNSRFPMYVWWGPDLIHIYNDAYAPMLGKRHPDALGKPARQVWSEIWPVLGAQAQEVLRGSSTYYERAAWVLERHGYPEEAHFTWSQSPILDEDGRAGGLLCVCTEDTQWVRAERERDQLLAELDIERARLTAAFQQSPAFLAVLRGPHHVFEMINERYGQLVGRRDIVGKPVREALPEIAGQGFFELLDRVYTSGEPFVGTAMPAMLRRHPGQPPEERLLDFVYQPVREADGSVSGTLVHGVDVTDRRRAEEALRQSEERLRFSLEASGIGSWDLDLTTRAAWRSIGHDRIFGYDELLSHWSYETFLEHVLPEDRSHADGLFKAALAGGDVWSFECRIRRRSGEIRWVTPRGRVARDATGKPVRMHGTIIDVTDRKRAEERDRFVLSLDEATRPLADPREITATYARLLGEYLGADRCAYADVEADQDTFNLTGDYNRGVPSIVGRYTFTNFGAEVLRLMRADEPYVVHDVDTHEPSVGDLTYYRQTMIRAVICVPLHKAWRFVAAMAVHQATPRTWTADEIELARNVAGRCWESIERARVERTLRESEERFRAAFDQAVVGMVLADLKGRALRVNEAFGRIVGYPAQELLGRDSSFYTHPDDVGRNMDQIQRIERSGADSSVYVKRYVRKDGKIVWTQLSVSPTRDDAGNVVALVAVVDDITDRKRADDELRRAKEDAERASDAKSEFLATLSHELRTPLTPVLLTVSLMESHPDLPADLREDVALIRRNVELESRLISDLLDLTRIERGKLQLDVQDVDLHLIVRSSIDICQREASAKLTVDLGAVRQTVRGDSTRLQQIFWNLINNAQKFTKPEDTITVRSFDTPGGAIRVEVSDTGAGIDAAVLPKLFNAFEQGEVRAVRQQAGLGLGLAISRRLAEAHGGTISASSAGRGRGATFAVELPVVAVFEPDVPRARSTATERMTRPLAVLLVEDHEATLAVMTKLLRALGHRVTGVSTVASATAAANQDAFDVIISDLGLPDGSGLDVMRRLRERYAGRAIALTGYGMESDVTASRDAGFAEHLTKPVDLAALQAAIHRVASSPEWA
ncbi:MAG: PAS domain S-box protein [Planctomycetota bacterium]|nr:PAS domain S-box protein [Planctomycetota bacterium]